MFSCCVEHSQLHTVLRAKFRPMMWETHTQPSLRSCCVRAMYTWSPTTCGLVSVASRTADAHERDKTNSCPKSPTWWSFCHLILGFRVYCMNVLDSFNSTGLVWLSGCFWFRVCHVEFNPVTNDSSINIWRSQAFTRSNVRCANRTMNICLQLWSFRYELDIRDCINGNLTGRV